MATNNRRSERIQILGDLQGEITMFQPMLVREIARGGAIIELPTPLLLNSLHTLRLGLGDTAVIVQGRVVHSRISDVEQDGVRYRTGLEFVETSDRVLAAIDAFLEGLKTERGV